MQKSNKKTGIARKQKAYPISPANSRGPPPIFFIESSLVNSKSKYYGRLQKKNPEAQHREANQIVR
jgi:hypothetical protein